MEKFLPVSVCGFHQMIEGNFVYIDKTRFIYKYKTVRVPQAYYFLSRPRRFGKSLTVSTLTALFESKWELFKGLWIDNSDWQWKPHPVVSIDFNGVDAANAESQDLSPLRVLDRCAKANQIKLSSNLLPLNFIDLLTQISKNHGEKVVVLIDEYDKPIISHLGEGEEGLRIAAENRTVLKKFFDVLKEASVAACLRYVSITGISTFRRVSIFFDLNNLQDLTMHADYAAMLGYTQEELEGYFKDRVAKFAKRENSSPAGILQKLNKWYDGYRFTEDPMMVYNPFSIVNAFSQFRSKTYWFETGTLSFPVNLIKERNDAIPQLENIQADEAVFSSYELENLQPETLLFQTGYLTIHDYSEGLYRLGDRNQEVKTAFLNYLYRNLVSIPDSTLKVQFRRLHQYLQKEDIPRFIETTDAILSAIPYSVIDASAVKQREAFYYTVFYLMVAASSMPVLTEIFTCRGRMDMAVEFKDTVYVIELKCNQPAAKALAQLHDKRYHQKHLYSGHRVYLIGISFDTAQRAITDWKLEAA